jgi:hypothetical protein
MGIAIGFGEIAAFGMGVESEGLDEGVGGGCGWMVRVVYGFDLGDWDIHVEDENMNGMKVVYRLVVSCYCPLGYIQPWSVVSRRLRRIDLDVNQNWR